MSEVHCYNKGCGQKFNPAENTLGYIFFIFLWIFLDSCLYHPGPEYFHDAYKIWQCCNKKSTDFSTWLSYKGCNKGPHNGTKPTELSKPTSNIIMTNTPNESKIFPETIVWNGLNKPAERVDPEKRKDKLQNLTVEVGENVLRGIADYKAKQDQSETNLKSDKIIGSSCKNNACKVVILLFFKNYFF